MPRILSRAPIDDADWHAGVITVRPWGPVDAPEAATIEDIGKDFAVVWSGATQHGNMNSVIMDDGENYWIARVIE